LLRSIFCLACVHPLPVFVAAVCAWLLAHVAAGLYHSLVGPAGLELHDLLGCGACIAFLSSLICLAVVQIGFAMAVAWRGDSQR